MHTFMFKICLNHKCFIADTFAVRLLHAYAVTSLSYIKKLKVNQETQNYGSFHLTADVSNDLSDTLCSVSPAHRVPSPQQPIIDVKKYRSLDDLANIPSACYPFVYDFNDGTLSSQMVHRATYQPNLKCVRVIKDGPFLFSPVIKKLCGSGVAGTTITTTGTYMRLVFYTDDVIEKTGFSLQFNESVPAISCYYNISFTGEKRVEISEAAVRNFYDQSRDIEHIDCVWDISSDDGKNIWLWVEDGSTHPAISSCSDRTIEIFSAENRLSEDFQPMATGSSPCYLIRRKLFPEIGAPRILLHVRSVGRESMPMIRINFTSYIEPNPVPENLCNGSSKFTCEDGRLCLDMDLVCNGRYNCPDGDDESEEACKQKNGPSFGLRYIFVGTAILFFVLVSVALFISAKRMIRENRENEVKKAASTVIVNHRQSRMFEKSMVKRLLDHLSVHDAFSHDSVSQTSRFGHCHHSARNSLPSKRGSWFTNGSISNCSIGSDVRVRGDMEHLSPSVSPVTFLSPDMYANHMELKRLRLSSS
ncbi:NETO2 [Bugula neritina]|uniref:NETO2 n=1 Tax=Bugula neritina TaxID=10212 RepID=A0A7J7K755_BUGNE|nr:NETO2 [Bugula neritina]